MRQEKTSSLETCRNECSRKSFCLMNTALHSSHRYSLPFETFSWTFFTCRSSFDFPSNSFQHFEHWTGAGFCRLNPGWWKFFMCSLRQTWCFNRFLQISHSTGSCWWLVFSWSWRFHFDLKVLAQNWQSSRLDGDLRGVSGVCFFSTCLDLMWSKMPRFELKAELQKSHSCLAIPFEATFKAE